MKIKVALYARVSTDDQIVENQSTILKKWAEDRDWEVGEIYCENESAWKAGHQRELARLLGDIRSGARKYDILLVWALDRLSREGAAAILNLVDTFKTYGVKVISLQESWTEAPGAIGEVLYAIAGWVAKMESERRSERTKAGLARVVASGKKLGRPSGSKDGGKRKRTGYLLRYANKR